MLSVVARAESPGSGGAESPARLEYLVSVGQSLRSWGGVSGPLDRSLRSKTDLTRGESNLDTTDNTDADTSSYCREYRQKNQQAETNKVSSPNLYRKRPREILERFEPLSAMMESTRWGEDPQSVDKKGGAAGAADPGAWRRLR